MSLAEARDCGAFCVLTVSLAASLAAQDAAPPVFTAAQADAGKVAYAKHCASCHMPDLSGDNERAPLTGPSFMTTWGDKSTKEFLSTCRARCPTAHRRSMRRPMQR